MFVLFPITTIHMKQPFLTSPQATPYLKPITFKQKTHKHHHLISPNIHAGRQKETMSREWGCTLENLLEAAMEEAEGNDEWWKRTGLMQLRLVDWFLNWNSQDISGCILTSVSEYSTIPSAPLEAFRLGIFEQSSCSSEHTKQPACCLGYQSID